MTVDRGGLRYTLEMSGSGPERVREFRAELILARRAWRAFKQDIKSLGAESKAMAQGNAALAKSTAAAAIAQAKLAKATQEVAAAAAKTAKTNEQNATAAGKQAKATKTLTVAEKERLKLQKQLATEQAVSGSRNLKSLRAQVATHKAINKALVERRKQQALSQKITRKELARNKVSNEVAKAAIALEEAKFRARSPVLARAKAELAVERQIAKEKEKQLINDIRAKRGLAPVGAKPTPATTDEAGRARFARDLRNAQIKEQTDLLKKNSAEWQRLNTKVTKTDKGLSRAGKTANRISFTFRRLFGILAAFAAARLLIRGFQNLIKQAVAFNAQIEISKLSIASLFVATSEVRDAMGQTVSTAQQLALAQQEAARQTRLLRQDALKTAATFEQLLDTFQVAIAPGTRAGLATDQIREFTVRISQAATSLGVAQNQLSEEIRSILGGTIQLRTTRIAAALGITNEDIRRAKEAGGLYEFLTDRFLAFKEAGEKALGTFAGLSGRVSDVFKQLFGAGTLEMFEQLKGLMKDIIDTIAPEDEEGFRIIDPDAINVIRGISKGLSTALGEARRLGEALDFKLLSPITAAFGSAIQVIALVIGAAIEGFVKGLSLAVGIVRTITSPFTNLFEGTEDWGKALRSVVVLVVQIATAYFSLVAVQALIVLGHKAWLLLLTATRFIWVSMRALVISLRTSMIALTAATSLWAVATNLAAAPFWVILAIIALIATGILLLSRALSDSNLELGTILRLIKNKLVETFKLAWINIKLAGAHVFDFFQQRLLDMKVAWIETSNAVTGAFAAVGQAFGISGAKELAKELADSRVRALEAIQDERAELERAAELDLARLHAIEKRIKKEKEAKDEAAIIADIAGEGSIGAVLAESFAFISDTLNDIFGISDGFDLAADKAQSLLQILENMPGILSQSRTELERQADLMEEIKSDSLDAQKDVARFEVSGGAESGIAQARVAALNAQFSEEEKGKKLQIEKNKLTQQRNELLRTQENLSRSLTQLSAEQRSEFELGLRISEKVLNGQREQAKLEREIALARAELAGAKKTGDITLAKSAAAEVREKTTTLNLLEKQLAKEKAIAEVIGDKLAEGQIPVLEAIQAQLLLNGHLAITEEHINDVLRDQGILHDSINSTLKDRLRLLAGQQLQKLEQEIPRLQQEQAAQQRLRPFVGALNVDAAGERVAIAKNDQARAGLELREAELQATRDMLVLSETIEVARDRGLEGERDLAALLDQRNALFQKNVIEARILNEELKITTQLLDEAVRKQEEGLQFGIEVGFAEFANAALDSFEAARSFMTTALENFSSLISQTIADAFDPTTNTDIREKFGQFLKSLSEMIINFLTQLAISKLIQSLIGGAGDTDKKAGSNMLAAAVAWVPVTVALQAAANTLLLAASIQTGAKAGGAGLAAGGPIPNVSTSGISRPRGLHPTDTVPIWAAPGEFMVRARAVGKYGSDVMQALNRGLIDPMSLRALSGVQRSRTVRASRTAGFAEGGLVSSSIQSIAEGSEEGTGATIAMVVADDQTADRILSGGRNAVFEFFRENSETFRSILRG